MQEFNLASSEKQDEILSNFPIETGTNWSDYTILQKTVPNSNLTTLTEVLNIEGEGYVDYINVYSRATLSSGGVAKIRITVDNEVIVDMTHNVSDGNNRGGQYEFYINKTNDYKPSVPFPIISNTSGVEVVVKRTISNLTPLFFKTNLKIEVLSTAAGLATLTFSGGVK